VLLVGDRGLRLECETPTSRGERARGLRGRAGLGPGRAILLERCTSIHTFGVAFPITVAWLDRSLRVTDVRILPPRRLTLPRRRRGHVLELGAGADIRVGDRLRIV